MMKTKLRLTQHKPDISIFILSFLNFKEGIETIFEWFSMYPTTAITKKKKKELRKFWPENIINIKREVELKFSNFTLCFKF